MNQNVSIQISEETAKKIREFYKSFENPNEGEYIEFQAKKNGIVITIYSSKKNGFKATFTGNDALLEARIWDPNAKENEKKTIVKEEFLCFGDQIGSDEVGCGDLVLPMVVVAAFVSSKDIKDLKEFGVHDSKKLNDNQIREIGEKICKRFFHSALVLNVEKYNAMIDKGENMNSLKAKMHNKALLNMYKKFPDTKNIFLDQFTQESTYNKYLKNESIIMDNVTFRTKAESYYPCVALASVIARYAFLLEKDKLEAQYGIEFPLGAGKKADEFSKEFIAKFGIEEYKKIARKNFINYSEAINNN